MIRSISVCGDSFGVGAGLRPNICYEQNFGGIVSNLYSVPLKVYARSGCCNFTIYLQVKKVIEQYHKTKMLPFVLISLTNHDRLILPINGDDTAAVDLSNIDYGSYEPYSINSKIKRPIEFNSINNPTLVSETINNIMSQIQEKSQYTSNLFKNLSANQLVALSLYIKEVYHNRIKQEYDISLTNLMHNYLNDAKIPHIFLGHRFDANKFINDKNFINMNWGLISKEYPDEFGTGHCNEIGHQLVANLIKDRIDELISSDHLFFPSSPS